MTSKNDTGDGYVTVRLPIRLTREEALSFAEAICDGGHTAPAARSARKIARDRAEEVLQLNRQRMAIVGAELFGDPAWNIMLDLFVRETDGKETTVTSACIGADAPSTTALRHLAHLVERQLVHRTTCSVDHRKVYVRLTDDGRARMLKLFG